MLPTFAKIRINMNKLKICNISLLAITPAVLATSIILEASHGAAVLGLKFNVWVIIHLVTVLAMTGIASVPQWLIHGHSPIGGVHSKYGKTNDYRESRTRTCIYRSA